MMKKLFAEKRKNDAHKIAQAVRAQRELVEKQMMTDTYKGGSR